MLKRVDRKPALSCSKYYSEMSRVPKHTSSLTSSVLHVSCHNNSFYLSLGGLPSHSSLFLFCSPFLLAFRDDSHLAFFFVHFRLQHFLLWCWFKVRLVSRLFFFSVHYFPYELLRNGEGKYGNCTIQDPIARTNDFLLIIFYAFPVP